MSMGRSIKAVAWSFLGIRKNSDHQEDLSPLQVIAVALVGVAALVGALIAFVNWVAG